MKTHKSLFAQVCSFTNLLEAAGRAQRGKRHRRPVARFNQNLEQEILLLQRELLDHAYRPGNFKTFQIKDPKPRVISAAPYRDRVVHHALCNVVEPIFDRTFIHDSYASRKGKGAHAGVDRLTSFMQASDYVLKCDISKYFPSIDHAVLKDLVRRKIGCRDTLWLIDLIVDKADQPPWIDYHAGDDLFTPLDRRRGLPIGNQTSQFLANVYLNPFDHFVKERLGCRMYIRYVDDFVVLGEDKDCLWRTRDEIAKYLSEQLRLRLHATKQSVVPVTAGIDFLGYRVYPTHRRIRKTSGLRFQRRLRDLQKDYAAGSIGTSETRQRIASWIGHARHADTYNLRTSLLSRAVFRRA